MDGRLVIKRTSIPEPAQIRHANMKQKLLGLSQHYVAALRKHLKPGCGVAKAGKAAARLGHKAVALGLETLELAQIHQHALIALEVPKSKPALLKRGEIFFAKANTPIEQTHRAARQGKITLLRLQRQLDRRTTELAVTHQQLQRGEDQRQLTKLATVKSEKKQGRYLAESLQLQTLLRKLTHRVLAAQEDEHLKISHELQDEITQTLVGIQVRLLTLKHEARGNTKHLKNQIAKAQQLVVNSAKSVRQFARKLNSPPQKFSDRSLATL